MPGRINPFAICLSFALAALLCALACAPLIAASMVDDFSDQDALASGYYDQQQWEAASKIWGELVTQFPDDPRSAEAAFFRGESLLQLGQLQTARDQFLDFLESWPEHARADDVTYRVGETAYLLGLRSEAEPPLLEYTERLPDAPLSHFAWTYLGEIAAEETRWTEARSAFEKGLRLNPSGTLADRCRYGLARALEGLAQESLDKGDQLASQSQLDEAIRFYEFLAFQSASDLSDESLLNLAIVKLRTGDVSGANEALDRLLDEALAAPMAPRGWYLRGRMQADAGEWDQAIESLRKGLSLVAAEDVVSRAGLQFELASQLAAQASRTSGDIPSEAIELWKSVADATSTEFASEANLRLIEHDFAQHQFSEVVTRCESWLQSASDSNSSNSDDSRWIVIEYQARALLELKRFEAASTALARELPKDAAGHLEWSRLNAEQLSLGYLYGLSLQRSGQWPASIPVLEHVLSHSNVDSLKAGALLALVGAYDELSSTDDRNDGVLAQHARAYLEQYADATEAAAVRSILCQSLARQAHWTEADTELRTYLAQNADHGLVGSTLAEMCAQAREQGSESWGARWMELFAEQAPAGPLRWQCYLQLADREHRAQRTDDAIQWWRRVLTEAAKDPVSLQAALALGKVLEERGDLGEAFQIYSSRWLEFKDSEAASRDELDLLVIALASVALKEPRLRADEAIMQELRTIAGSPTRTHADQALYQLAWIERAAGKEQASIDAFERLIENFPQSSLRWDAAYRLAEQALRSRDAASSRRWLEQLQLAQREWRQTENGKLKERVELLDIQLLAVENQWTQLEQQSLRFVSERPDSSFASLARFWSAEAAYRNDDRLVAKQRFDELWAREQASDATWLPMVPLRLGQLAAADSDWDQAAAWGEKLKVDFPEFRQMYEVDYLLGRCSSSRGEFSEAREAYEKVVRSPVGGQSETAAMAQWMIGESYFHQQQYSDAIDAYQKVKTLYPYPQWQAASLLQAAKCYELKNDPRQAITLYAQLLRDHADSSYAEEASKRLLKLDPSSATSGSATTAQQPSDSSSRRLP